MIQICAKKAVSGVDLYGRRLGGRGVGQWTLFRRQRGMDDPYLVSLLQLKAIRRNLAALLI